VPWIVTDSLEVADALRADAYAPDGPIATGFLPSAAHVSVEVRLPAQRCVAFVGRATVGMQDLDAALYLPDGTLLAEDEGADAEPLVQFCSDEALPSAYLVLRAYRGAGSFAVSRWSRAERLGDSTLTAQELADGPLRELGIALRRRGFHPEGGPRAVRPAPEQALLVPIDVKPHHCYAVLSSGAGTRASLRLLDEQGREMAHALAESGIAALQRCAGPGAGPWAIELRGGAAEKAVRVWLYDAEERDIGGERALWLGEPNKSVAAYAPPAAAAKGARRSVQTLEQGRVVDVPLVTKSSGCTALHVALSPPLGRVHARVESPTGASLAERSVGPEGATLNVCGPLGTLVLTGEAGSGTVTIDSMRVPH
jgi:hypothetical protein